MRLSIKVVPKSSRDAIVGWLAESLKLTVTAAPEQGKANAAVEALIAKWLGLAKSDVSVVAGFTSPHKVIEIVGMREADVLHRLEELAPKRAA